MAPLDETKLHSFMGRHIVLAARAQRATHYDRESGMPLPFHDLLHSEVRNSALDLPLIGQGIDTGDVGYSEVS